jgi:hypothetical protein
VDALASIDLPHPEAVESMVSKLDHQPLDAGLG